MGLIAKQIHDAVTLQASTVETATSTGTAVRMPGTPDVQAYAITLDVTAAATAVGDELDVFVQSKLDGTNFVDVVHFTKVLGNGGPMRFVAKIAAGAAEAEFETGTALGAAAVRNLLGDEWLVRWDIVDTGAASFTFSVVAVPM